MRLPAALLLLALALGGTALPAAAAEFAVQPRDIVDYKVVFATVESVDDAQARSRISGTVTRLDVKDGDAVTAGQQVALVVDQKQTPRLNAIDARIKAAVAQLRLAETELKRAEDLLQKGAGTKARADQARAAYEAANNTVAALRAERALTEQQSAEGAVLAPESGRILKTLVTTGTVVQPGEPIADIAIGRYVLRMMLPERHARFLRAGDKVLVGPRGLGIGDKGLGEGEVVLVYPQLDHGRVVADVSAQGLGDFFVGERTRVWVGAGTRRAILVPPDFLIYRFGVSLVRLKDGTEVVVQLGEPQADGIEVLSGLKAGDVLVSP
jgi:RND family efflux transporter MFP subunit